MTKKLPKVSDEKQWPTKEQVNKFDLLYPLLIAIYTEMQEWAKRKPHESLNPLKVKIINKRLEHIKDVLVSEPTLEFLDLLDDAMLPSNSDAVLIISQYKAAMDQFKQNYQSKDDFSFGGGSHWNIQ